MLTVMEGKGSLDDLARQRLKIYEYSRVIKVAFMHWTGGAAKGLIQHDVDNGLDVWRKLCHRHVPLADDLRNI